MLHPALTWRGGAERQILILGSELQQAGHHVEIFTLEKNANCFPELQKSLNINVVHSPFQRTRSGRPPKRTAATRLAGRFKGYTEDLPSMVVLARAIPKGFDVINCHNVPTQWAAFLAKRRLNAPVVWSCNEPPFWYSDAKQRRGLGRINLPLYEGFDKTAVDYVDVLVSNSTADSRRIEQAYGKRSITVRPGITADLFREASGKEARIKYGLEGDFVLLQVGNIAKDKRQSDSVAVLHNLSINHKNIKLVLVGSGPREELTALSKRLNVDKKVLFFQNCSDKELADLYAACDVFVFPAQITWGLVVMEAMASGKPVVVSREAGASEVIENGKNGFIVNPPYAESMAAQIEKLIENPDLRAEVGRNAYDYTKNRLSWEAYGKSMEKVFQKAVKCYRGTC